jgi:hypothetical protein
MDHSPWEAEEAEHTVCNNFSDKVSCFNKISLMLVNKLQCLLLTGERTFEALCQGSLCLWPTG